MGYDAIDALTERDYTPDYITTDTDIFLDGVVDDFISAVSEASEWSCCPELNTLETGALFAWYSKQIDAVRLTAEGVKCDTVLHPCASILLDGIDRENFVVDMNMLVLAMSCLPAGARAITSRDKIIVCYTGEYERIGMPSFYMGQREFLRMATKPYAELDNYLFGYAKSYAGIDEED